MIFAGGYTFVFTYFFEKPKQERSLFLLTLILYKTVKNQTCFRRTISAQTQTKQLSYFRRFRSAQNDRKNYLFRLAFSVSSCSESSFGSLSPNCL